jgi:hypothetical protein
VVVGERTRVPIQNQGGCRVSISTNFPSLSAMTSSLTAQQQGITKILSGANAAFNDKVDTGSKN